MAPRSAKSGVCGVPVAKIRREPICSEQCGRNGRTCDGPGVSDSGACSRRGPADSAMKPILIVDYGMAHLRSLQKALEQGGHAGVLTGEPNRGAAAEKVVLAGA